MAWQPGATERLQIVTLAPPSDAIGGTVWEDIAGKRVTRILRYDEDDDSYLVMVAGLPDECWVPSDWIEQIPDAEMLRRAWRDEQLSEAQRQLAYAAAFQRLMWREMMGRSVKKRVGDRVTIRSQARTIERAFPTAWLLEWYAASWGRTGIITDETREFGVDGELYRGYKVRIQMPESTGFEETNLWWLGEDLEA
jgi:hypothetical protein